MTVKPTDLTIPTTLRNATVPYTPQRERYYVHQATAINTRRAYQSAIRQYEAHGGLLPADEAAVARYLVAQAALLNPRTLSLHLTALSHWHRYQQLPDPTQSPHIRKLLKGIQREHGRPKRKAKALQAEHIHQLVTPLMKAKTEDTVNPLKALRDKALILLAYFGAFRRSELLAIQVEHLQFEPEGLLILVPRSKTDVQGQGIVKALPYANDKNAVCPVRAVQQWLAATALTEGILFRAINRWGQLQSKPLHLDSLNTILKSVAQQAHLDLNGPFSSHSLRRGFATSAARAGADFMAIKRHGGWQNDHVVRSYIEEGQCFEDNAARTLLAAHFNKKADS